VILTYEVPLDSHSVREAYFLGQRNDEKTTEFLSAYVKHPPFPEKGPYISEIELLTPYAQVLEMSREKTVGYSAQDAEEDYRRRGDTIRVRVRIEFTPTYGPIEAHKSDQDGVQGLTLRPPDFWKAFRIGLKQHEQWIEPCEIYGEPTYEPFPGGQMTGALVWYVYDAHEVASEEVSVEVFTPDGQHVVATFDLAKLR
jgi:hypothetical protein